MALSQKVMQRRAFVKTTIIAVLFSACFDPAQAQVSSPLDIQFRRQAVRRLVFDHDSAIPLSMLTPSIHAAGPMSCHCLTDIRPRTLH